jgi:hypothetical protein
MSNTMKGFIIYAIMLPLTLFIEYAANGGHLTVKQAIITAISTGLNVLVVNFVIHWINKQQQSGQRQKAVAKK